MNPKDVNVLRLFASRLREAINAECDVRAFGSRARGDAAADSDLDVCVVVDSLSQEIRDVIREIAWEVGFANDIVIATVKCDRQSFFGKWAEASPLIKRVRSEGVAA